MVRRPAASIGIYSLIRGGKAGWRAKWEETDGPHSADLNIPLSAPFKDAEAAFTKFVRQREAALAQDQKLTIGVLIDRYKESLRVEGKNSDKVGWQWVPMKETFEALQPADLETEIIVQDEKRTRCHKYALERSTAGIARQTIHSELAMLRTAIRWAAKHGLIAKAPFVWVPPQGKGRKTALSVEQINSLIASLMRAPYHVRLFLIIAMSTAARKEAILELTWDRVDFALRVIDFNRGEEQSILDTSHIKGRAIVDMNDVVFDVLMEAHEYHDRDCPYVIEWKGQMVQDPKKAISAAFRRAGIVGRYMGAHALRHTLATHASALGIDPHEIQKLLGHKKLDTTTGVYIGHKPGSNLKAASVLKIELQAKDVARRSKSG